MKRIILIALLAVCSAASCVFGLSACGESNYVSQDNMSFTLIDEDYYYNYLKLTTSLEEEDVIYDSYALTNIDSGVLDGANIVIPSEVNGKPVTLVTANLVSSGIKSIVFPDSVIAIDSSFYGCEKLESVTLPAGLKKTCNFNNCPSLKSINIPDSVTYIGDFSGCKSLESINIPDGVTLITSFSGCTSLKSITIPDSVKTLNNGFSGCTSLETVVLPSELDEVGYDLFYGCTLKNITASAEVLKAIGLEKSQLETVVVTGGEKIYDSFFACADYYDKDYEYVEVPLTVTLPSTIREIGKNVFVGRKDVTLNFPDEQTFFATDFADNWNSYYCESYTTIGENGGSYNFERCNIHLYIDSEEVTDMYVPSYAANSLANFMSYITTLDSITVDPDNEYYFAQDNVLYNKSKTEILCVPAFVCSSVTVPYGVQEVKKEFNTEKITEIVFPDSVTYFERGALQLCTNLESLSVPFVGAQYQDMKYTSLYYMFNTDIPQSLKTVAVTYRNYDTYAFNDTNYIENLIIGDNLTSISGRGLSNLKCVTIGKNVKTIENFYVSSLIEIYNLSDLNLVKGSSENGNIAKNALGIYTTAEKQNNVKRTDDGYEFFENGNEVYFLNYYGTEKNLVLPETFNGKSYNIHNYALYSPVYSLGVEGFDLLIESIVIPDTVTYIGNYAFCRQTKLKSISCSAVTSTGEYAFYGCIGLVTVDLPAVTSIGNWAFDGCTQLVTVNLPAITQFAARAFSTCGNIQNLVLGSGLNSVGELAFYESTGNIVNLTAPAEYVDFFRGSKTENVVINGGTAIKNAAFYNCTTLKSIELCDGITSIGDWAFYGCTGLESLKIPASVVEIGADVFTGCAVLANDSVNGINYVNNFVISCDPAITVISLREGTTHILENAFKDCILIESIVIPDSVIFIGAGAFSGCVKLRSVTIPVTTGLGGNVFENCKAIEYIDAHMTVVSSIIRTNTATLKTVIVSGADSIEQGAFYGCSNLESLTLPFIGSSASPRNNAEKMFGYIFGYNSYTNSVAAVQQHTVTIANATSTFYLPASLTDVIITGGYLYQGCFSGCTNIRHITLPDSITQIEMRAFYSCTSLESFVVPEKVEVIDQEAFSGCESLASLQLSNTYFIRVLAFENCSSLEKLVIPKTMVSIEEQSFKGCNAFTELEFELSDWGIVNQYNQVSSLIDVSDTSANATKIYGSWLNSSLCNVTRLKEYYHLS